MAWSKEQRNNASIIVSVGRQLGATARDIQTALMAAIVESNLINVNYGDRDSLGLFQQRDAWGTSQQRLDPYQAARMFYTGGHGGQEGLFDKGNRTQIGLGEAAQSVQVSAFPDRYAEHQTAAANLLDNTGDTQGVPGTLGAVPSLTPSELPTIGEALTDTLGQPVVRPEVNAVGEWTNPALAEATNPALAEASNPALGEQFSGLTRPGNAAVDPLASMKIPSLDQLGIKVDPNSVGGWRKQVLGVARQMLGTPYVWGGTDLSGVDCSGLLQLAFSKAGIDLPRISADQARAGKRVGLDKLKPGDLVAWDTGPRSRGADHIAIYAGNGQVIEAPRPGTSVQIANMYDQGNAWGVKLNF